MDFQRKTCFSVPTSLLFPCFTQLQARVSSEEGGGSCAFYYMSSFPGSSFAYRYKTRQNMFSFIKRGNYSYFFCQLGKKKKQQPKNNPPKQKQTSAPKVRLMTCVSFVNNILRYAGIFQIDSWRSAWEGLWFWRTSVQNSKNGCN